MALQTPGRCAFAFTQTRTAERDLRPLVHVDVADPLVMLDHRDAGLLRHAPDEPLASPRDDEVDVLLLREQGVDRGPVGPRDEGNGVLRQSGPGERFPKDPGDRHVRADRLRPPAQDHGVPGLDAQGRGVRGDVGPRLVDDRDHPEGDPHPADQKAVGAG